MRHKVLGLDVSANRIAWALCDSVKLFTYGHQTRPETDDGLIQLAAYRICAILRAHDDPPICLEINLHPKLVHKGRIAANMVRAYMRSRWVEGALLESMNVSLPIELARNKRGLIPVLVDEYVFALQATGGQDAKQTRRRRMTCLYGLSKLRLTEDEVDALAIAHDCSCALAAGIRKREG